MPVEERSAADDAVEDKDQVLVENTEQKQKAMAKELASMLLDSLESMKAALLQ